MTLQHSGAVRQTSRVIRDGSTVVGGAGSLMVVSSLVICISPFIRSWALRRDISDLETSVQGGPAQPRLSERSIKIRYAMLLSLPYALPMCLWASVVVPGLVIRYPKSGTEETPVRHPLRQALPSQYNHS